MRLLRLERQHIARWNEPHVQLIADVGEMGADASERGIDDLDRRTGGDDGPVCAGHFQFEIGARGVPILSKRVSLRSGRPGECGRASSGVDGPLQIDARADVVGNVGIDEASARNAELLDVVGARIAGLQRHLRHRRRFTLVFHGERCFLPRADFRKPMARIQTAHDGLVQREPHGRLRTRRGSCQEHDDREQCETSHANLVMPPCAP